MIELVVFKNQLTCLSSDDDCIEQQKKSNVQLKEDLGEA
jgi:hypothetical protein